MTFKELASDVALNYIGGPAAVAGYAAASTYDKLTQKKTMGTKRVRKRKAPKKASKKQRTIDEYYVRTGPSSSGSVSRSRRGRISNVRVRGNSTVVQYGGTRSGRRVSKSTGTKKIKVSRKLRKKIKEVIKTSSPSGYYQERFFIKFTPVSMQQTCVDLGGGNYNGEFGTADNRLWLFDPCRVLNVASTLFNGKVPVANKTSSAVASVNLFDRSNIQIDVLRQWVEFNIKNNTARSIEIKLWTWELKKVAAYSADGPATLGNFVAEWADSFASETLRTIFGSASASTTGLNTLAVTPLTIGASPSMSHSMREKYNIEERVILLEPGRTFKHNVQGPRKLYDFGKFNQGSSFTNGIKGIKGCAMGFMVDNTMSTTFGPGNSARLTNMLAEQPYGIAVETVYHYVIRMPEQAGFKVAPSLVAGDNAPLNYRRDKPYAIKVWNNPGGASIGSVTEVNEENPAVAAFTAGL